MPINTKFFFDFIKFIIEKTQICLNLKLLKDYMQFKKKTSFALNSSIYRTLFKLAMIFGMLFLVIVLLDRIEFPYPSKDIKQIIPNEKFKVIK